jgi:cytochrome c
MIHIEDKMTKSRMVALAASLLLLAAAAPASADLALAKAKGCTACHDVSKKVIGPPYSEVAKKYKADKEAAAKLQASVLKGSTGKWGAVPMPPNKLTDDEAKKLVAWVLSL